MGALTSKEVTTPIKSKGSTILVDPRSPSDNVSRTPIAISNNDTAKSNQEGQSFHRIAAGDPRSLEANRTLLFDAKGNSKYLPIKPSKLIDTLISDNVLDAKSNPVANPEGSDQEVNREIAIKDVTEENEQIKENIPDQPVDIAELDLIEKATHCESAENTPLKNIENSSSSHEKTLEDEFNRTQDNIIKQLSLSDSIITTDTEFIENI